MIYSSPINTEFQWHRWYAWFPVRLENDYSTKVWREHVERRKVVDKWVHWQYRLMVVLAAGRAEVGGE